MLQHIFFGCSGCLLSSSKIKPNYHGFQKSWNWSPWYDSRETPIKHKSKTLDLSGKLSMLINLKWAAQKRKTTNKQINRE